MKFYDRLNELETLARIEAQSTETACFTIMVGRRRSVVESVVIK